MFRTFSSIVRELVSRKPQKQISDSRYLNDEVWPRYARERLSFLCKPMKCLGAGIAVSIVAAAIMVAVI